MCQKETEILMLELNVEALQFFFLRLVNFQLVMIFVDSKGYLN